MSENPNEALEAGVEAHRQGDVAGAAEIYRRILSDHPDHAGARHMTGVVHLQQGRPAEAEAEIRRAIDLDDGVSVFHQNLANVLVQQTRFADANDAFAKALSLDPQNLDAAFGKGVALLQLGRARAAEAVLRKLLEHRPGDRGALSNLVTALGMQNKTIDAVDVCRKALEGYPEDPLLWSNLANALERMNDLDGAAEAADKVVALGPDEIMGRVTKARLARRRGDAAGARASLGGLVANVAGGRDEIEVLHELGQALDELGETKEAFEVFSRRNRAKAGTEEAGRFDGGRFLDRVVRNRTWFTGDRIKALAKRSPADAGARYVFFVGFPRSGTTLMERILMAHPSVLATEEASPLVAVRRRVRGMAPADEPYPDLLDTLTEDDYDELRQIYYDEAAKTVGPVPGKVLVDKLPFNIVELGLVNILFPGAKVVVALRDPRDVCLSCFMQRFRLNDAMVNLLDIEKVERTYTEVMGLWQHYRGALTIPFMEYRYEDLVTDFEGTARSILKFIGLEWDEAVRDYRSTVEGQAIKTPSYEAVAAPITDQAAGRWASYSAELTPILPNLAPFVTAFGYDRDV